MKILYITPNVPRSPGTGSEVREYYLIQHLSGRHEFHVFCPQRRREEAARRKLAGFCRVRAVPFYEQPAPSLSGRARQRIGGELGRATRCVESIFHPFEYVMVDAFRRSCRRVLERERGARDFDLVEFQHSQLFETVQPFLKRIPVIANLHNVNYAAAETAARHGRLPNYFHRAFWRKLETKVLQSVDLTVTVSASESRRCRDLFAKAALHVVMNGTDASIFRPADPGLRSTRELMFCGLLDYGPNVEAVHFFAREILPRVLKEVPDCRFLVVGKNPPGRIQALSDDHIQVLGWVEDIVPYFQRCAVFVAPIRWGGGTRLKILDALASEAPVVATRTACDGLPLADGRELLIREEPEAFASAVVSLVKDSQGSKPMCERARRFVEGHFDWRHAAASLETAYGMAHRNFKGRAGAAKRDLPCAAS